MHTNQLMRDPKDIFDEIAKRGTKNKKIKETEAMQKARE